jgi:pantothenate kinase-related protein Tda10
LSFDKGFFLTIRAIQLLKKQSNGKPILVGIAGPSGAGKTGTSVSFFTRVLTV